MDTKLDEQRERIAQNNKAAYIALKAQRDELAAALKQLLLSDDERTLEIARSALAKVRG